MDHTVISPLLPAIVFAHTIILWWRLILIVLKSTEHSYSTQKNSVFILVLIAHCRNFSLIIDFLLSTLVLIGYYNSVTHCVTSIVRKEGIHAFYLSLGTTLMMNVPYGCIMVAANESARKVLNPSGEFSYTSSMLAGIVSIRNLRVCIELQIQQNKRVKTWARKTKTIRTKQSKLTQGWQKTPYYKLFYDAFLFPRYH